MGKDYTEIRSGVKKYFDLDMPIEVIDAIRMTDGLCSSLRLVSL